jgi:hypothetical protein
MPIISDMVLGIHNGQACFPNYLLRQGDRKGNNRNTHNKEVLKWVEREKRSQKR